VQERCRAAYRLFLRNPRHRSLRFKKVHDSRPIYAVRVSRGYRALGIVADDEIEWFWVGTHADYDKLLHRL
jgi:hypothetical protein